MTCNCQACGREYYVDLIINDAEWAAISPKGNEGGLLCGPCILERMEQSKEYRGLVVQSCDSCHLVEEKVCLQDENAALRARVAEMEKERDEAQGLKAEWLESLRGVRDLLHRGESERALLWCKDALSGHFGALESTLLKVSDQRNEAVARAERAEELLAKGVSEYDAMFAVGLIDYGEPEWIEGAKELIDAAAALRGSIKP